MAALPAVGAVSATPTGESATSAEPHAVAAPTGSTGTVSATGAQAVPRDKAAGMDEPAPSTSRPRSARKPQPQQAVSPATKSGPSATPEEIARRIAAQMAILRAERAEKAEKAEQNVRLVRKHANLLQPPERPRTAVAPARRADAETATHRAPSDWRYAGDGGPTHWAEMQPDWAICGDGKRQSPIDIRGGIKLDLEPIAFDYKPVSFAIIDTGHTIQVDLGAGDAITVLGRTYALTEFHFHRPAEETIDGHTYQMVVHLTHKDASGKLAVVAVLLESGPARALVQTIWNNLPLEKNEAVVPAGTIDLNALLPGKRDYYTYMGSLTTPPCSEGVLWMVMKEPVSVSQEQLDVFARLYQMNARPIQASSERLIKESK